jgi:hypothetical protein
VVVVVETGVGTGAAATGAVLFRAVALPGAFLWCERPVTTGSWLITAAAAEDLGIEPGSTEVAPETARTRPVAASVRARTPTEDR